MTAMGPNTPLSGLSLLQLQSLAARCGINRSGTKAALARHLGQTLHDHTPLAAGARVLSVDLGIRNLAYSLLQPSKKTRVAPAVHAWNVLSLGPAAESGGDRGALPSAHSDFGPPSLSDIAVRLVRERFLPLKPTHVLVERQRFRSGGGAAIYEWTVRVNSLEAMLYATLNTLRSFGHWEGSVIPIDPKRVGAFLLEDPQVAGETDREKSSRPAKKNGPGKSSREIKKQKIDLLGRWLADDEIQMATPEAEGVRAAFLERWQPKRSARTSASASAPQMAETMKKLDDPADSLLQGIAWLRWEANRTRLKGEYGDVQYL